MKKTIDLGAKIYTSYEDLVRVNKELEEKTIKGLLMPIRQEDNCYMFAEPQINGIWSIYVDANNNIEKIVLW